MIFAGCERFLVFMGGLEMILFSEFVFKDLGWKFGDIQRSSCLRGVLLFLLSPLLSFSISCSNRVQKESRAPP